MKKIIEPDEVFSAREIKRLERWISYYENPLKPAIIAAIATFFGVIALIILIVQLGVKLPPPKGGIEGELFIFSCVVGAAVYLYIKLMAENNFSHFDKRYFELTGMTEQEYLNALIDEVRREASLRFTDMPNGENITMFQYPEEQRAEAYKIFEADFLKRCTTEEDRLKFKAYVARRYGMRVPFKK
jgi:hypothetical protein